MKQLLMILVISSLYTGSIATEGSFIDWWRHSDEQVRLFEDSSRRYLRLTKLMFDVLPEYHGSLMGPPGGQMIEKAFVLYTRTSGAVLLVTPENVMKNKTVLNEDYRRSMNRCAEDRSWIVSLPENAWTEIDLNPYCTMGYDEDSISIDLYWLDPVTKPLIEIITAGLKCKPHRLYAWDRKAGAYRQKAEKCTGLHSVESYAAGGPYRQLPPVPPQAGGKTP